MKLGQTYTIVNDNFGAAGELAIQINGLTLPVRVEKWDAQEISFTLPVVGMAQSADGVFDIAKPDHNLTKAVAVTVVPADVVQ